MRTQLLLTAIGLMAVAVTGIVPGHSFADDRPQEVLDLIADHQALVMKIRPLRYRVVAAASKDRDDRFGPESPPVRAEVKVATEESNTGAENRVPERLRHKDRSASDDDDRITDRLAALEKHARTERERVSRPDYGVGISEGDKELIDARKKLAALQREVAVLEREVDAQGR